MSRRRDFGATWWGRAWIDALENRARLDPNRLPRGRTYARHDYVEALTITEGAIEARVHGSRAKPYRVRIRVRRFDDREWERAIAAITGRAAHSAALLDGDLAPEIVEDLRGAGIELLPGPGELGLECSCPDWASPCKHAAAVCYLTANALDADPFAILLLRGRHRDMVLASLRRSRASGGGYAVDERPGPALPATMTARAAAVRSLAPLPASPEVPSAPGRPVPPATDPPAGAGGGVNNPGLVALATDAARRAHALLAGAATSGLDLDRRHDIARLAAGAAEPVSLARRSGLTGTELTRLALAWAHGGPGGVDALEHSWDADPERLAAGVAALRRAGERPPRVRGNTVIAGDVSLRLGTDGRWYRLDRHGRAWDLSRPPALDPTDLLDDDDLQEEREE